MGRPRRIVSEDQQETYPCKFSETILNQLRTRKVATGLAIATQIRQAVEKELTLSQSQKLLVPLLGKGGKRRMVPFGLRTARALWELRSTCEPSPDTRVFLAGHNQYVGDPLTPSGVCQIIQRIGRAAGVELVRCSPHTFRHTFAVEYLRAGGDVFTLQRILGHTSVRTTQIYVGLAAADIQAKHRQFSPGDRLGR